MIKYILISFASAAIALALTPVVRRIAVRFGAVDIPGGRRIHCVPTPRFGGLAVYVAILAGLALACCLDPFVADVLSGHEPRLAAMAVAAAAVMLIGLIDDLRSLSPVMKLTVEILAATLMVASGCRINGVFGWELGWWGMPISVLWMVAVTNGVNMIDGLDGLAVGAGLISSATLLSISLYLANAGSALILASLCGALFGFLCYNFHPARIFLGDSGSLLVGFLLAVTAVETCSKAAAAVAILVPMLAVGLPLGELVLTTLRRILRTVHVVRFDAQNQRYKFLTFGHPALFTADRDHIHHRLLALGITQRTVVVILYGVCMAFGLTAFVLVSGRAVNLAMLLAVFAFVTTAAIRRLGYRELQLLRNGVLLPLFDQPATTRRLVCVLFDLGSILASWFGASVIYYGGGFSNALKAYFLHTAPLVALVQLACFMVTGLYRRSYRYAGITDLLATAKALALAAVATWIAVFASAGGHAELLGVAVLDTYLLGTLVTGSRLSFSVLEYFFCAGRPGIRRAAIYGAGNEGFAALRELQSNPSLGMEAVCFFDDDPHRCGSMVHGIPVYSSDAVETVLGSRKIDELIITTPGITRQRLEMMIHPSALAAIHLRRFQITLSEIETSAGPAPRPFRPVPRFPAKTL